MKNPALLVMVLLGVVSVGLIFYFVFSHPISFAIKPAVSNPCGPTGNCVETVDAVVSSSCAPWDGPAIETSFAHDEGSRIYVDLYGKGLDQFNAGQTVTIKNSADSQNGTGSARSCDESGRNCMAFPNDDITISLPKAIIGASTPMRGTVILNRKGTVIPLNATWSSIRSMCG